ncbi:hypothetical protein C8F01DRAFT_727257 [Mycena amicta]|nr:hypothetical protein C8F01DRAFT_727257 [Mycena amicta]
MRTAAEPKASAQHSSTARIALWGPSRECGHPCVTRLQHRHEDVTVLRQDYLCVPGATHASARSTFRSHPARGIYPPARSPFIRFVTSDMISNSPRVVKTHHQVNELRIGYVNAPCNRRCRWTVGAVRTWVGHAPSCGRCTDLTGEVCCKMPVEQYRYLFNFRQLIELRVLRWLSAYSSPRMLCSDATTCQPHSLHTSCSRLSLRAIELCG